MALAPVNRETMALGLETLSSARTNSIVALQQLGDPTVAGVARAVGIARETQASLKALKPSNFTPDLTQQLGVQAAGDAHEAAGHLGSTVTDLESVLPMLKDAEHKAAAGAHAEIDVTAIAKPLQSAMEHLQQVPKAASPYLPRNALGSAAAEAAPSERASWATTQFLDENIGKVSETRTQRLKELPYGIPEGFEVQRVPPGTPLDMTKIDPEKVYVWSVEHDGTFNIAPEAQPGFGITEAHPEGRNIKHGDLPVNPDGLHRPPQREGGMLYGARDKQGALVTARDGKPMLHLNNNSSYVFVRGAWKWPAYEGNAREAFVASKPSSDKNLLGVYDMLERSGTDMSHIEATTFLHFKIASPEHPAWFNQIVRDASGKANMVSRVLFGLADKLPKSVTDRIEAHGQKAEAARKPAA